MPLPQALYAQAATGLRSGNPNDVLKALESYIDQQIASVLALLNAQTIGTNVTNAVRVLDDPNGPWIISDTQIALVTVSFLLPVKRTLTGTDSAAVAFEVDGTEIDRASYGMTLGLLTVNDSRPPVLSLSHRIKPGQTVYYRTVAQSGTAGVASPSIYSQREVLEDA